MIWAALSTFAMSIGLDQIANDAPAEGGGTEGYDVDILPFDPFILANISIDRPSVDHVHRGTGHLLEGSDPLGLGVRLPRPANGSPLDRARMTAG